MADDSAREQRGRGITRRTLLEQGGALALGGLIGGAFALPRAAHGQSSLGRSPTGSARSVRPMRTGCACRRASARASSPCRRRSCRAPPIAGTPSPTAAPRSRLRAGAGCMSPTAKRSLPPLPGCDPPCARDVLARGRGRRSRSPPRLSHRGPGRFAVLPLHAEQSRSAERRARPLRRRARGRADPRRRPDPARRSAALGLARRAAAQPPERQSGDPLQVPAATPFDGGEGCFFHDGRIYFTTKGDDRVWCVDTLNDTIQIVYDRPTSTNKILNGLDNVLVSTLGDIFVAEDGDDMQINVFRPGGRMAPVVQAQETESRNPEIGGPSEITGPALSPDGRRLYFSSQRGDAGNNTYTGVTYEVYGPFV